MCSILLIDHTGGIFTCNVKVANPDQLKMFGAMLEGRICRNLLAINHIALLYNEKYIPKCWNVQADFLNKASKSKNWTILFNERCNKCVPFSSIK